MITAGSRFVPLHAAVVLTALLAPAASTQTLPSQEDVSGLEWRAIGPADMGGRTVDIAAIPGDPNTVYFATAAGGLWRTTNQGVTWASIFESGGTLSLGPSRSPLRCQRGLPRHG